MAADARMDFATDQPFGPFVSPTVSVPEELLVLLVEPEELLPGAFELLLSVEDEDEGEVLLFVTPGPVVASLELPDLLLLLLDLESDDFRETSVAEMESVPV